MDKSVPIEEFHSQLVNDLFQSPPNDEEILCLMLIFHACHLTLSELADVEGRVKGFEGITTRHASEVVASLFASGEKSQPAYWYERWNGDWRAYALLEDPPRQLAPSLASMRDKIQSHPWVKQLANEDWEILPN